MASIESLCESLVMALLAPEQATGKRLEGVACRHHETDADAELDCIIVKAEAGEEQEDGVRCRPVAVTLTYASGTATPDQADKIAAAMSEAPYNIANFAGVGATGLAPAYIDPAEETRREDSANFRKRTVTLPFLAKLAS